jgi:hypothetical protein
MATSPPLQLQAQRGAGGTVRLSSPGATCDSPSAVRSARHERRRQRGGTKCSTGRERVELDRGGVRVAGRVREVLLVRVLVPAQRL